MTFGKKLSIVCGVALVALACGAAIAGKSAPVALLMSVPFVALTGFGLIMVPVRIHLSRQGC